MGSLSVFGYTLYESAETAAKRAAEAERRLNDPTSQEYWEARGAIYSMSGKKMGGPAEAPMYCRSSTGAPAPAKAAHSFSTTPAKPAITQPPKAEDTNTVEKVKSTSLEKINSLLSKTGLSITTDADLEKARNESAAKSKDIIQATTANDAGEQQEAPAESSSSESSSSTSSSSSDTESAASDTAKSEAVPQASADNPPVGSTGNIDSEIKKMEEQASTLNNTASKCSPDCNLKWDTSALDSKKSTANKVKCASDALGTGSLSMIYSAFECVQQLSESEVGGLLKEVGEKAASGDLMTYKGAVDILGSDKFPKLPIDLKKLANTVEQKPTNISQFGTLLSSSGFPSDSLVTNTGNGLSSMSTLPKPTDVTAISQMSKNGLLMGNSMAGADTANSARAFANLQKDYKPVATPTPKPIVTPVASPTGV